MTMTLDEYKTYLNIPLSDTDGDATLVEQLAELNATKTPLEYFKIHLNVVDDADDVSLEQKLGVATAWVCEIIGREHLRCFGRWHPVHEATRQLAGHLVENREATIVGVTAQEIPFGVMALLDPYRRWYGQEDC